jgi:hypothetical protein
MLKNSIVIWHLFVWASKIFLCRESNPKNLCGDGLGVVEDNSVIVMHLKSFNVYETINSYLWLWCDPFLYRGRKHFVPLVHTLRWKNANWLCTGRKTRWQGGGCVTRQNETENLTKNFSRPGPPCGTRTRTPPFPCSIMNHNILVYHSINGSI